MRRAADNASSRFRAGAVARRTRKKARGGPAAVAVADDAHVKWRNRFGSDRLVLPDFFLQELLLHEHGSFSAASVAMYFILQSKGPKNFILRAWPGSAPPCDPGSA